MDNAHNDPLHGVTNIDDAVELWHTLPEDNVPLHEFLGLTWDQYAEWVEYGVVPKGSRWDNRGSGV